MGKSDHSRRSFFTTSLGRLAGGWAAITGASVAASSLAGCPRPTKYGGPPGPSPMHAEPITPQPTKYGGPPTPTAPPPRKADAMRDDPEPEPRPRPMTRPMTKYGGPSTRPPRMMTKYGGPNRR